MVYKPMVVYSEQTFSCPNCGREFNLIRAIGTSSEGVAIYEQRQNCRCYESENIPVRAIPAKHRVEINGHNQD